MIVFCIVDYVIVVFFVILFYGVGFGVGVRLNSGWRSFKFILIRYIKDVVLDREVIKLEKFRFVLVGLNIDLGIRYFFLKSRI